MNHLEIYEQTQQCINHIRKKLKEVYSLCDNTKTIEKSNYLFYYFLDKAKKEAFKMIDNSLSKPHVIYRVNKYYQF